MRDKIEKNRDATGPPKQYPVKFSLNLTERQAEFLDKTGLAFNRNEYIREIIDDFIRVYRKETK